jgi:hypothetical protein
MISGHLAIALGLRAAVRREELFDHAGWLLPALVTAAIAPDLLDLAYAKARFCSPLGLYSHALLPLGTMALSAFVLGWVLFTNGKIAGLLTLAVLIHLPADFITGEKLLWVDGPVIGLNLYRWPIADFFIELPVIVTGWSLLRRAPGARTTHPWATSALALVFLIGVQGAMDAAKLMGNKVKPSGCVAGTVAPGR